jgi:hypothetical protein
MSGGGAGVCWAHKPDLAYFKWWGRWQSTAVAVQYATRWTGLAVIAPTILPAWERDKGPSPEPSQVGPASIGGRAMYPQDSNRYPQHTMPQPRITGKTQSSQTTRKRNHQIPRYQTVRKQVGAFRSCTRWVQGSAEAGCGTARGIHGAYTRGIHGAYTGHTWGIHGAYTRHTRGIHGAYTGPLVYSQKGADTGQPT